MTTTPATAVTERTCLLCARVGIKGFSRLRGTQDFRCTARTTCLKRCDARRRPPSDAPRLPPLPTYTLPPLTDAERQELRDFSTNLRRSVDEMTVIVEEILSAIAPELEVVAQ